MSPPRATYRLQFREGTDFAAAAELAPYLARLGVSHLYASPIFAARSGSSHGYDITDFNQLDPALGGMAGFERMVEALKRHRLGLILDFVPNHMAASVENPWWRDVLQHGQASRHAISFDVDWARFGGRVLAPVLGDAYEAVLERGEITVEFAGERFWVRYFDHRFPVAPASESMLAGADPGAAAQALSSDTARLHQFLEAQHYRLSHWRLAPDAVNYRRFFDINELAVIRVDRREVYDRVHELVFGLIREGSIDGLRLDHVDGLRDPALYLQRLHEDSAALRGGEPFYLVVEKILGPGETLRSDWPVHGTTGYEFANLVTGLQIDAQGLASLRERYCAFTGDSPDFHAVAEDAKRFVLGLSFAGSLRDLVELAAKFASSDLATRDIGNEALRRAITEVLIALPVYRPYVTERGASAEDAALIEAVCASASERLGQETEAAVAFIRKLMLAEDADQAEFAIRLQQVAGPLMAKSIEDTAFYRWVPLVARNEVGGEPGAELPSLAAFHAENTRRLERWPAAMLATATHDTKRGEDARARLAALSTIPDEFADAVERWWAMQAPLRRTLELGEAPDAAPDAQDAWLFYQALIGAWPDDLTPHDRDGLNELSERLQQYMEKALREAKRHTRWTDVNAEYETAMAGFIASALDPGTSAGFLDEVRRLIDGIVPVSAANALAQLVVKLTAPGVPDIYQGTEWWDFSLVDPDNRRPVDFAGRAELLDRPDTRPLDPERASTKQAIMHAALELRQRRPELFARGEYRALEVRGPAADALMCYARVRGEEAVIACATRCGRAGADKLAASAIVLPQPLDSFDWWDVLAHRKVPGGASLELGTLLASLPVALLCAPPPATP